MRTSLLFCLALWLHGALFAQADTTSRSASLFTKAILPTTLIATGSIFSGRQLEKTTKASILQEVGPDFHWGVDDYLVFSSIGTMYLADLFHVPARNDAFDQTKYLILTLALNQIVVNTTKAIVNKTRPDGDDQSFPSGHTAFAFAGATVLWEEYHETRPWLAYSGYVLAATTGTLRMLNNRHWLSDVVAGAGIGILTARIIYHYEPLRNWRPFGKKKLLSLQPMIGQSQLGVRLVWQ